MAECVRQSAARTPPACAHTHTLTHTHTHTHTKGRSHILARARPRGGGGAGGEDAQRPFRARRPRRPRAEPAPISSGASPSAELTKWGRPAGPAPAGRRAGARGGAGAGGPGPGGWAAAPRRLGRPAATEVRGVGAEWREGVRRPPRAAPRLPQIIKKNTPRVGGGRQSSEQEWLLSLILVYSKKLQTGRV
ncbi:unnamed protein product [Nyctereutes procyonoides]|uniref:(raccoon dog) hypothetical protein n=1 Tax=Nyctereutes procyonoides TaxID=34880 RepID=A0A811Y717_NYCPR|nr:unnamed protein product [Nyctereutes procyonoides]